MQKNAVDRYSAGMMAMHWLMFLLLVAVYATIELRVIYDKGTDPREALKAWHFMLGMSVFVLIWLRLMLRRLSGDTPRIRPEPPAWQQRLATLTHGLLYLLMIGMPLSGWLVLSAAGKPIPFFGLELPPLMGKDVDFAKAIKEVHEVVGTVGYFLIGLHVVAALYHRFVVKDDTLQRMLPSGGRAE